MSTLRRYIALVVFGLLSLQVIASPSEPVEGGKYTHLQQI